MPRTILMAVIGKGVVVFVYVTQLFKIKKKLVIVLKTIKCHMSMIFY
jgi:hypothetical protein